MASLKRALGRLARSAEEIRAENLHEWSSSVGDVAPIGRVEPRRRYRVAGMIQQIRIDPREGRDSIEATIRDGTGELSARWLGRRSLAGIALGGGLVVEGVVGTDQDGVLVVLNPAYELVDGPEHR